MERTRRRPGTSFLPLDAHGLAVAASLVALAACAHGSAPVCLDPPPLPSGVVADVRETTYPVFGHDVQALHASLGDESPEWLGEHVWGLAQWRIAWTHRPLPHAGHCDLADVMVLLTVDITLPEWGDRDTAPAELGMAWDSFVMAVRAHENGHRDRAFLAAEEIQGVLSGLHAPECGVMAELAEARATEVLEKHVRLDRDYDRRTRRGVAQGASWPPGTGD